MVTPMQSDGNLDLPALHRLVDFHVQEGTNAIVPAGTTGEAATLNFQEHCRVVSETVQAVNGRVPVIAGTGANATAEAIRLSLSAARENADACLLITPYYNKPTQEGLYQHYRSIAEAVDIPQILYNVPPRTACDMLPETVCRLSKIDNIVGIKEASGDPQRTREISRLCGEDFMIFSGEDAMAADTILHGGHGVISVTANVAPRLVSDMCRSALAKDRANTERIDQRLQALHEALFCESNPIPVKWLLCEMGKISSGIRLPLTWLSQTHHSTLRSVAEATGILAP